jgi:cobalamin biosynthesis protein CobT
VEYYTLGMAAKAAGVSKTTISKAISNGKISVVEKHKDGFKIDPSELHRVFPMVTETIRQKVTNDNPKETGVTASQETEIRLLREMLKREQEQNQFLQDQLARSTLLLEAVRNQPEAQQQRKGLIAALFGR